MSPLQGCLSVNSNYPNYSTSLCGNVHGTVGCNAVLIVCNDECNQFSIYKQTFSSYFYINSYFVIPLSFVVWAFFFSPYFCHCVQVLFCRFNRFNTSLDNNIGDVGVNSSLAAGILQLLQLVCLSDIVPHFLVLLLSHYALPFIDPI